MSSPHGGAGCNDGVVGDCEVCMCVVACSPSIFMSGKCLDDFVFVKVPDSDVTVEGAAEDVSSVWGELYKGDLGAVGRKGRGRHGFI